MKVLSLFDGMACGMLAMLSAGVEVERYVAYEIDKYAVQTSTHNFPIVEHKGDVFTADFTEYQGFDWLVGGSPCTYWSIAQTKNRETTASGLGWELFSQYVRALHEAKPKYFIYENNKSMSKSIRQSITEAFGFEPICINSALVSAQNRQRLYWVGIKNEDGSYRKANVEQPEDKGILLKDILETSAIPYQEKSDVLTASYNGAVIWNSLERHQRSMVAEPVSVTEDGKAHTIKAQYYKNGVANFITNGGFGASAVAEPINTDANGKARTIIAGYGSKQGISNCLGITGFGSTGVAEPICLNSKSGRGGVEGIQPSLQDGIYSTDGKSTAVTTSFMPSIAEPIGCIQAEQLAKLRVDVPKSTTVMTIENHGWTNQSKTAVIESLPECFRVKEATKQGYTEIKLGGCVDMSMPNSKTRRGRNMETKSNCLQTSCQFYQYCGTVNTPIYEVKDGMITVKGKQYPIKLVDGYYIIRKLTVRECMRLQTVPEWYEFPVSNSQAYKMLGNGWTVDVIVHLINSVLKEGETQC